MRFTCRPAIKRIKWTLCIKMQILYEENFLNLRNFAITERWNEFKRRIFGEQSHDLMWPSQWIPNIKHIKIEIFFFFVVFRSHLKWFFLRHFLRLRLMVFFPGIFFLLFISFCNVKVKKFLRTLFISVKDSIVLQLPLSAGKHCIWSISFNFVE